MDRKLKKLFDYQRIAENPRIKSMTDATQKKYMTASSLRVLSDDELSMVNAAGSPGVMEINNTDSGEDKPCGG